MRMIAASAIGGAIAWAAMVAPPAMAMPNVFWTFGYRLPVSPGHAPRFGANMPIVAPTAPAALQTALGAGPRLPADGGAAPAIIADAARASDPGFRAAVE